MITKTRMRTAAARLTIGAAFIVATPLAPVSAQPSLEVIVENALDLERRDETIALPWGTLRRALPTLAPSRVRVLDAPTGREIVTQVVDANADGHPDDLLFQASFWPGETRRYTVEAVAPTLVPIPKVHVKYVPERSDVAWESDRSAYRTYGQKLWALEDLHSSGIDVWPKRTRELVLDRWYAKGHDGYHVDTGEGADFFRVGPTLGAGGTAVWRDGRLHRAENFARYRIIADGPIRAIFELEFDPWDAGGVRVTETKRVSIDAGQNLYRQESIFRGDGGRELPVAVGFVKRKGVVGSTSTASAWAWLSGWGPIDRTTGGHGDLGTAALVEKTRLLEMRETGDHYVALFTARAGERVVYYAGAGWSAGGDFHDASAWWAYLDAQAQRLASPVRVTIRKDGAVVSAER